jgi:hypothetical protein
VTAWNQWNAEENVKRFLVIRDLLKQYGGHLRPLMQRRTSDERRRDGGEV